MPHIHEKIDFVAEVFVVFRGKVLLRIHDKLKLWLSVGGHIELDEDPAEAAVREVKEEVGLEVELYDDEPHGQFDEVGEKIIIRPQHVSRHNITDTHEHVAFIYYAKAFTNKLALSETEVTDKAKWFTKEELDDPKYILKPKIKFYAKEALEKLGE